MIQEQKSPNFHLINETAKHLVAFKLNLEGWHVEFSKNNLSGLFRIYKDGKTLMVQARGRMNFNSRLFHKPYEYQHKSDIDITVDKPFSDPVFYRMTWKQIEQFFQDNPNTDHPHLIDISKYKLDRFEKLLPDSFL